MITVIAEKPSVAKDIASFLGATTKKEGYLEGNNYCVTWAYGHLVELKDFVELGYTEKWSINNLPFIPNEFGLKLKSDPGAKKQFKVIKELFKNSSSIICATDAGREGELIFRYIYNLSQTTIPFERLWISSLTEQSIKEGFNKLQKGSLYDNLFYSAKARNEADYLVGINATIAMTCKGNIGLLSLGRVQTPTLALICQRFIENKEFVPKPYFVPELLLYALNKAEFKSISENSFETIELAEAVLDQVGVSLKVSDIISTEIKETAPTLFDLTLLQREANKKFGYTAQETLNLAQSLYETHKILSYPRTSSKFLSDDMLPKIPQLLNNIKSFHSKKDAISLLLEKSISKKPINNNKVTDHHAIIPTEQVPNFSKLSTQETNLYNMVIDRFLQAFHPECLKDSTKIIFETPKANFISRGIVIKEMGWRIIGSSTEIEEDEENIQKLPTLKIGETISVLTKKVNSKMTQPLPIHSESSLLQLMETAGKLIDDDLLADAMKEGGLGTPATRASIIETLIHRQFIMRDKKKLLPTDLGLRLYQLVRDLNISKAELTGEWEYKLAQIEKGEYNVNEFNQEIKSYTAIIIESIKSMDLTTMNKIISKCNYCSDGEIIELGNGYKCTNAIKSVCEFPTIYKTIGGKTISEKNVMQLITTGKTEIIKNFKNKEGKTFDAALIIDAGTKKLKYDFTRESVCDCPKCKSGKIEKGKSFYKCNTEECDFIIWNTIAGKQMIDSNIIKLIKDKRSILIKGFISKTGKTFDAFLILDQNFKIQFDFPKK